MTTTRWLVCIALLIAVAGVLLSLRQQRLRVMHETIQLHRQAAEIRQELWDQQVQISQQVSTPKLQQAIDALGLELSPIPTQTNQSDSASDEQIIDSEINPQRDGLESQQGESTASQRQQTHRRTSQTEDPNAPFA